MCTAREMTDEEKDTRDTWLRYMTSMIGAAVELHGRLACDTFSPVWMKEMATAAQRKVIEHAAQQLAIQVAVGHPRDRNPTPPRSER